jgi:hypothetical protein
MPAGGDALWASREAATRVVSPIGPAVTEAVVEAAGATPMIASSQVADEA